jgi:rSAM/selenodomain-associated transferase 2
MNNVSIIIPTLNEAKSLARTLRCLKQIEPPAWEILVVDGGSEDETIAIAKKAGVKVISAEKPGRASQMNEGAQKATGEYLCFVHGDTLVPDDLVTIIGQTLANKTISAAGFISLMTGDLTTRWGVSLHNWLKTYYAPLLFRPHLFFRGFRLLFGDQVIFTRRADFWKVNGFNGDQPIMEEADLCFKLVKLGSIRLINRVVYSSDRRVAKWGFFKVTAIYLYIGFLWKFGASPQYLKRFYEDIR